MGQLISTRNDRALAQQEVDLLKKLRPESRAAIDLEVVISSRIGKWRSKHQEWRIAANRALTYWAIAYVVSTLALLLVSAVTPDEAMEMLPSFVRIYAYILWLFSLIALVFAILYLCDAVRSAFAESRRLSTASSGSPVVAK